MSNLTSTSPLRSLRCGRLPNQWPESPALASLQTRLRSVPARTMASTPSRRTTACARSRSSVSSSAAVAPPPRPPTSPRGLPSAHALGAIDEVPMRSARKTSKTQFKTERDPRRIPLSSSRWQPAMTIACDRRHQNFAPGSALHSRTHVGIPRPCSPPLGSLKSRPPPNKCARLQAGSPHCRGLRRQQKVERAHRPHHQLQGRSGPIEHTPTPSDFDRAPGRRSHAVGSRVSGLVRYPPPKDSTR